MITTQDRLFVIEDFKVDRDLPKFQKRKSKVQQTAEQYASKFSAEEFEEDGIWNPMTGGGTTLEASSDGRWTVQAIIKPTPWWKRWFAPKPVAPTMSILDFFKLVKNSQQELVVVQSRAAGYEAALTNARLSGQKALMEKLEAGLNAFRMETQLLALGLNRYVEEEAIVRFYKQSKKGLRLDWIRNFTRPIPEAVIATKTRADELGIFDNYVVLHYDPQAKSYAETKAEVDARKDPILFGLMKDRTQLYCVGDWVDEHCDLTLDQFADLMGATAVQTVGP